MNDKERRMTHLLKRRLQGKTPTEVVDILWREGLLNRVEIERQYISDEVERRVRDGVGKVRAIEIVAYDIGCSYEKVRAAVYRKR